jgi:hypothetical protein
MKERVFAAVSSKGGSNGNWIEAGTYGARELVVALRVCLAGQGLDLRHRLEHGLVILEHRQKALLIAVDSAGHLAVGESGALQREAEQERGECGEDGVSHGSPSASFSGSGAF